MIIHEIDQKTDEWMRVRMGKVTASEMSNLVTTDFALRKGEMPFSYLTKKLAEKWRGSPLPGFTSTFATENGEILEGEARAWFCFSTEYKVKNVGFIEGDDSRCGCSPDALLDEDGGLELKAPNAETHVKYLLRGELPPDYSAQVHMSMYVSGRPWWIFCSYRRGFPPFVLKVHRDEEIIAKIAAALDSFYRQFDEAMEKLKSCLT
jgi:hypothetical protein